MKQEKMLDQTARDFVEVCKAIRDLPPERRLALRYTSYRGTAGEYLVYVTISRDCYGLTSGPADVQVGPTILHWDAEEAGLTLRDLMVVVENDARRSRVASSTNT
jgi:hypothetical protein